MKNIFKILLTALLFILLLSCISCSIKKSDNNSPHASFENEESTACDDTSHNHSGDSHDTCEETTYITEDGTERVLTSDKITELSSNKNIIVFVVDRFDSRYMDLAIKKTPEVFDRLEGFTYFADHISLYGRTFPSITYMATGCENDFSLSRKDYFRAAYSNSSFLDILKENNYDIKIYTDGYYGYSDASVMGKYVSNLAPANSAENTYTTDQKAVFDLVSGSEYTLNSQKNNFSFIHIQGCHLPNSYDESFEPMDEEHTGRWDELISINTSMQIIDAYIAKMKKLGVYDSSTIVIVGDHAAAISDTKELSGVRRTALLVKPSGSVHKDLKTSFSQVSHENLWQTILKSENILHAYSFAPSAFDIPEGELVLRKYVFQRMDDGFFENICYAVNGASTSFDNWTVVHRENIDGSVHQ